MPAQAPIAPLAPRQLEILLFQVSILLGVAMLLGRLARQAGPPAIVGEPATGVLLGPSVLAPLLIVRRLQRRNVGRLILTAGMVDDIMGWILLSSLSAMATSGVRAGSLTLSLACLAGTMLFAVLLGPPPARSFVRVAAVRGDSRPLVGAAVVLILLAAAGTHAMSLEAVFGAFLCGIVLRASGVVAAENVTTLRVDLTGLADLTVLGAAAAILAIAVIMLVAVVTSVMAPPLLQYAMARARDAAEERLPISANARDPGSAPVDRPTR